MAGMAGMAGMGREVPRTPGWAGWAGMGRDGRDGLGWAGVATAGGRKTIPAVHIVLAVSQASLSFLATTKALASSLVC